MKISNLTFCYENKKVFENYSAQWLDGNIAVMGESGIGKTTLLKLIAGLLKPQEGTIESGYEKPAFMFQEDRLLPWLNVRDNVLLVCKDQQKVEETLKAVGIDPELKISQLSGGMARRVALVRALLYDGDILLLDEPFKGMDQKLITRCAELIRQQGKPIIMATHSLEEAQLLDASIINI